MILLSDDIEKISVSNRSRQEKLIKYVNCIITVQLKELHHLGGMQKCPGPDSGQKERHSISICAT